MSNPENSDTKPRALSTVVVLVIGAALGVATALVPSCAHLDTGSRLAGAMAEHCGDPDMTDADRRACMESFLEASLECAANHVPGQANGETDGDTDGDIDGE